VTSGGGLVERVLDATYAEVAERGLGALTVEAVAVRAGSSRATLYRHFPGGRDELITRTIGREVERFFAGVLASTPAAEEGVLDHVAGVVRAAHRLLGEHAVLQRLLADEADAIVPSLATVQPLVASGLALHLEAVLADGAARGELRPDVDVAGAADHGARLVLSYVGSPGRWDLADPDEARRLVRDRLLAGVLADG
jgi:AcrR family transcriptional regulator